MTNEIKLNSEIIGKNGIRLKTRLIESKDIDKIVEIVNWAYRGKDGTQPWTTEEGLVSGLRVTPEMIQDDLNKDNNITKMMLVEHILDKQAPQDGADVESDQKETERLIIGCVKIERDTIESKDAVVGMLSVDPSYQSNGIGSVLINLAEQEIKNWGGVEESHLHVVNVRDTLIGWYKKLGYIQTTTTYPFEAKGAVALREIHFVLLVKKLTTGSI